MQAGLIWRCDRYQLRVSADAQLGGAVMMSDGATATIETRWAPSPTTVLTGIRLTAGRRGVQPRYVQLEIPALSVDTGRLYGGAGNGQIEALLEIDGLAVHLTPPESAPLWRVSWSAMRFYLDGAQAWSTGAGVYSSPTTCGYIAPAGVPLFGIPATLAAECLSLMPAEPPVCSIEPGSTGTYPSVGPHSVAGSGGWRFRPAADAPWVELPVSCTVVSPPAPQDCQCTIPTLDIPSATTTWDGSVSAHRGGTGGSTFSGWNRYCSVTLLPSVPRRFDLENDEYAALWVRGGFPRAVARGISTGTACAAYMTPVTVCDETVDTERLPAMSEMLSTVAWEADPNNPGGRLTHAIEDVLSQTVKCPYSLSSSISSIAPWPSMCFTARSGSYPVLTDRGPVLDYLDHSDEVACYINTWANPHWSYGYWFPAPASGDLQPWEWPVDGSRVSSDDYWVPLRVQWLYHPSLPESERRRTRTTLTAACVDGFLSGFFEAQYVAGSRSHWVGVCRPAVLRPEPPASVRHDAAGSGAWSGTGCSLSFSGTTVTVGYDGSNQGLRVAELDMDRFSGQRWLYPFQAVQIGLDWPAAQVTEVRVLLVGADGTAAELHRSQTPPSSPLAVPQTASSTYAGSWARDGGAGIVSDTGADLAPGGVSSAYMADPERSAGFALGTGRQHAVLRFEIVPANPTGSVDLQTPVFHRSGSAPSVFVETQGMWASVWPDGPCVRLGGRDWWDASTEQVRQTPVAVPDALHRPTALDLLCEAREMFEGADRLDGLDARLAALFDAIEGQTRADARLQTRAWLRRVSGRPCPDLALVNELREVPALCQFPLQDEAGAWVQRQIDAACEPRWLVWPTQDAAELRTDAGTDWLDGSRALAGWTVRFHRHAVDNSEAGFKVRLRGASIASVRPWWGWVFSPHSALAAGEVHACRCERTGHVYAAWSHDGQVELARWDRAGGVAVFSVATGQRAQCCCGSDGEVLVGYEADSTVYARRSTSYGHSWSTAVAIGTGTNPAVAVCARSGLIYVSLWRDGAHRLYKSADRGATFSYVGPIVTAPEGRAGLEVAAEARGRLNFVFDNGGTVERRVSGDFGKTWSTG